MVKLTMVLQLLFQVDLLVDLHHGSYVAMTVELKVQARRMEKSIHETER